MPYYKNTHHATTTAEAVTFVYELHENNSLTRIYKQDSTGTTPVEITAEHRATFRACRQVLDLQEITKEEFTKIMYNL